MAITRAFLNSQRYDESKGSINNTYTSPIIINGDMNVTQRGDQTGITSENYTTADRYVINISGLGTWSFSSSTDNPGFGFGRSLKIDCTTADGSPGSGDNMYLTQVIEGQNLQMMRKGTASAKTSTIAYWIKSNKTGNYVVELWDRTNDRHVGKVATISQANTWEKHVCNFPADTSGALANTNARSIMVSWAFDSGSNFTSGTLPSAWGSRSDANRFVGTTLALGDSTDNEVLITGVQFEMGTYDSETMPPFKFESFDDNLLRCQRYYQQSYSYGTAAGANTAVGFVGCNAAGTGVGRVLHGLTINPTMRAIPTITIFSTDGTSGKIRRGDTGANIDGGSGNASNQAFHVENSASVTDGEQIQFQYRLVSEL